MDNFRNAGLCKLQVKDGICTDVLCCQSRRLPFVRMQPKHAFVGIRVRMEDCGILVPIPSETSEALCLLSTVLETPPDPRTGATSIELDPLEWIHRITSHIPDPGRHCQRFYGAYSNRGRISVAARDDKTAGLPAPVPERDDSDCSREARSTWARLIKKIFEADPLLCPCGGRMRIVSFITDPRVVDRILRHRQSGRCKTPDLFEPRPPPGASAKIRQ
jgi:hypothetical protein